MPKAPGTMGKIIEEGFERLYLAIYGFFKYEQKVDEVQSIQYIKTGLGFQHIQLTNLIMIYGATTMNTNQWEIC